MKIKMCVKIVQMSMSTLLCIYQEYRHCVLYFDSENLLLGWVVVKLNDDKVKQLSTERHTLSQLKEFTSCQAQLLKTYYILRNVKALVNCTPRCSPFILHSNTSKLIRYLSTFYFQVGSTCRIDTYSLYSHLNLKVGGS